MRNCRRTLLFDCLRRDNEAMCGEEKLIQKFNSNRLPIFGGCCFCILDEFYIYKQKDYVIIVS